MGNKTLIFKAVPVGEPVAGEHLVVEDRPFDASAAPPPGGVTLCVLYASFDPYLRGKMRDAAVKSYTAAFEINGPVMNFSVARVLKSDTPAYVPDDLVVAVVPIAEYVVLEQRALPRIQYKIENPYGLEDLGLFIGPLGMPGLTAYSSLYEIGKPKKGETIYVSSAAGAVGQLVGQLAKREGLYVVGSVGSDDKLDFILGVLGFDAGFNYKKEKVGDALKRLAPGGIDIYYENVGGEQLEAVLTVMKDFGRIVACGMISQYNLKFNDKYGVKTLQEIVARRLLMQGFIVSDPGMGPKYKKEHQENVQKWLADGSFKAKLHETVGIENAVDGLLGMFRGENYGKAVLKIVKL